MGTQSSSPIIKPASKTHTEVAAHPLATQNILHWDDLPTWMQTDPYIRRGYRRQLDSLSACFWSLFYLHNDFVNTWSHLLPALCYLSALTCVEWELFSYHPQVEAEQVARREDVVMVHLYVVGTVICLLASVRVC